MAEAQGTDSSLKYLGFVQFAIHKVATYIVTIYEVAKENAGSLKSGVDSVEGTVKTVVGPVYQKIDGKPYELLQFIDSKVGTVLILLDAKLPEFVKSTIVKAVGVIKCVPDFVSAVAADVQKRGIYGTLTNFYYKYVTNFYYKYEPLAEAYGVQGWNKLVALPYVQPAAGYVLVGAGKINEIIKTLKDSQVPLVSYLPLIPLSYIGKAIKTE